MSMLQRRECKSKSYQLFSQLCACPHLESHEFQFSFRICSDSASESAILVRNTRALGKGGKAICAMKQERPQRV
jgi:hypothetical protein